MGSSREPSGPSSALTRGRVRSASPTSPSRRASLALSPEAPVTVLAGVTPAYAKKLERLGILTVRDLLQHYPRRHEDFSSTVPVIFLADRAKQTVKVQVEQVRPRPGGPA